ncbi:hypothetical protein A2803_04600 [Candidatus Woesebacteria bacterium RIFCSPHIGHO2_01_FULL_44_21]|uniref:Uncharacterized protein n=1 Tax=Candidatus Woesebacteria bacterium RIFCSPHIGHO2_01_FULL_44_21 TaxID=1802503 RepID=A0A1F7YWM0_9BACT|nr:MAG: hypothetical protein A2803_04600 [Candidatus Woesebacteria bacterium RIFCSPHIGHO2_01_FULL_44_21]OGM71351.1 MAG: hypothetical protein A2897_00965 [Candidatus Woesebacteria bacterium RIFCSPLOWO2_01_FULL_44_24b]
MNVDTSELQEVPNKLFQTIGSFNLPGGLVFSPNYLQAGAIVLCLFLLILTFGMLQHRYNHWTIKGILPGVGLGFFLALLIEAILLVGGRTMFTELLGWKDAPKPISNALDASRSRLVDVLGITDTIPESKAEGEFSEEEKKYLRELLCPRE